MSPEGPGVASVYLGTSDFAATVLRALADGRHRPALVVTPPDRRQGRGRRMSPPPVALAAAELGIELHQTSSINEEASRAAVLATRPDVALVCAFGQLIRQPLIGELPMLNVHPSLLPRWRGAAPIERALMAGDGATGVCIMRLGEGLDDGPVALREEVPIGAEDTYGTMAAALAELSGRMLIEALDLQAADELEPRFQPQDEEAVTYAEKIEAGERRVDPARSAGAEALRIRGLTPHVGAYAELDGGERLGVRAARLAPDGPPAGEFGERDGVLLLGCHSGALIIEGLQPAGGRWMAAADYVRGRGLPSPLADPRSGS